MRVFRVSRGPSCLAIVLLAVASPLFSATINVTGGGSAYDLAHPCASAVLADLPGPDGQVSLPEAICVANNTAGADTITLGVKVSLTSPFALSTSVGGAVAATPDITSAVTIIAGGGNQIDRGGTSSSYRIFYIASGGSLTLSGIKVVGGYVNAGNPAGGDTVYGAGAYVAAGGTLNVTSSLFGSNVVLAALATNALNTQANVARGGGIANFGTTTIDSSFILDNIAKGSEIVAYSGNGGEGAGGGIFNAGTLTVTSSSVNTNQATGGSATNPTGQNKGGAARGAAIFNATGATATLSNTTFQGNIAFSGGAVRWSTGNSTGGAVHNDGNIPSITGCTFDTNIARPAFSYFAGNNFGAAIYNGVGATIGTISATTFTGNWSRMFEIPLPIGGSFLLFTVANYAISGWDELQLVGGNNQGGAIFNRGTIASIINACQFLNNEARGVDGAQGGGDGLGGAIANGEGGVIHLIDGALFQANRARGGSAGGGGGDAKGGAIFNAENGQIDTISNCTFTGNNTQGGDGFPIITSVEPTTLIKTILSSGGSGEGGAIFDARAVPAGIITGSAEIPQAHIATIDKATFNGNYANGGGGIRGANGNGGAIYVGGKLDTITNSTFLENTARGQFGIICSTARGGAIYLAGHTTIPGTSVSAGQLDTGPAGPLSISTTGIFGNLARGGDGQSGNGIAEGGGIYDSESALTLSKVALAGNTVQGGAAFAGSGSVAGSAIKNESGALNVTLCLITGNHAVAGGAVKGGDATGALWTGGNATITQSRIEKNDLKGGTGVAGGDSRGGGIFYSGDGSSSLNLSDVTLSANVVFGGNGAGNCSGHGGGLYVDGGTANVARATISDNLAGGGSGQACDGEGGGIFSSNAVLKVVNSTINGNKGVGQSAVFDAGDGRGGGICVKGNQTVVLNSTIADNNVVQGSGPSGFQDGGGIFVQNGSTAGLFSTILFGNTKGTNEDENCWGNVLSLDYNLIGPSPSCTLTGPVSNNKSVPPNYALLANNGGPLAPDRPTFTRALLAGSPAINAGSCSVGFSNSSITVNNTVTTDQRNGTRAAPCDIGAFEFGASLIAPPSATPVFLGTPVPGALALTGTNGSVAGTTISVQNVGGAGTALNVTQVSLTAGYTVTGLPISGLASGVSTNVTVQCTVPTLAGTLTVGTNESPAGSYAYTLTCVNPAATAPLFSSNPLPGSRLSLAPDGTLHLTVTNQGPAGTLLDVTNVSSNPGFTVASGLPITALASGQSATIIVNFDASNQTGSLGLLALQTNESGSPIYEYSLPELADVPALSTWMLIALGCSLGLFACVRLTRPS